MADDKKEKQEEQEEKTEMDAVKRDIDRALLRIFESHQHTAYLCHQVRNCNADEPCCFSRGFVSTVPKYDIQNAQMAVSFNRLTDAFDVIKCDEKNGMHMIDRPDSTSLDSDKKKQHDLAFDCLLNFWKDHKTHEKSLASVRDKDDMSETADCAVLAVHLFSKLVPGGLSNVTIAKGMKGQCKKCPCGCDTTITTGDTGIGNSNVWFGFPDMLIKHTAVTVAPKAGISNSEDEDIDAGGDQEPGPSTSKQRKIEKKMDMFYTVEVKKKGHPIYELDFCKQVLCQCLTNGFAQKSRLNFVNNLVPSVGCTISQMLIYLYDPDQDILMRSLYHLDVIDEDGCLVLPTVIELWLILNLHTFGSTMPDKITKKLNKCGFKKFLEDHNVLDKYRQLHVAVGRQELVSKNRDVDYRSAVRVGAVQFLKD